MRTCRRRMGRSRWTYDLHQGRGPIWDAAHVDLSWSDPLGQASMDRVEPRLSGLVTVSLTFEWVTRLPISVGMHGSRVRCVSSCTLRV